MSVEEDIELKNLVAQTLENKGILPKIRAELRANVFLALEENPSTKDTLLKNDELSSFLKVPIGTLVLNLIREFLEFFELEFTLSVFEPETKYGKEYNSITRDKMINELKIEETNKRNPLLLDVINKVVNINKLEVGKIVKTHNDGDSNVTFLNNEPGPELSPVQLNTTYVKKIDNDSNILSPVEKDDTNDSIKEEVISINFSEANSLSDVQINLEKNSGEITNSNTNKCNEVEKTEKTNSMPKETLEIDLLTFTPVKDNKGKDMLNAQSVQDVKEGKTEERKEKSKLISALGDLPPLNAQSEDKDFNIKDLKAIMDSWSEPKKGNSNGEDNGDNSKKEENEDSLSLKLKSETKSQKSDVIDGEDDFEDDTSEIISSHSPLETPQTVDETISKTSQAADYLESI